MTKPLAPFQNSRSVFLKAKARSEAEMLGWILFLMHTTNAFPELTKPVPKGKKR